MTSIDINPFALMATLLFGSGVIGAIFYGIMARIGWMNIIGVCLP